MAEHIYTCRVLAENELAGRSVVAMTEGMLGPAMKGEGELDMLCGSCGRVIAQDIDTSTLTHLVIRCPCGAANDTDLI